MFNKASFYFKSLILIGVLSLMFSCQGDKPLTFIDFEYNNDEIALIEINIQTINNTTKVAKAINNDLTHFVCASFNIDSAKDQENSIEACAKQFNDSYSAFKKQLNEELFGELPNWEVLVDGELSYQNDVLVSFAMSSSINTGGIKPITKLAFFNFDKANGNLLDFNTMINDAEAFNTILESYLTRELNASSYTLSDFKTDKGLLKNPDHIGYNDAGLIIFYNTPNNGFIECMLPYSKVNDYLNY